MKNIKTNKKGFTLVELLVVMAVIAVLALLAVPKFMSITRKANEATFDSNHRLIISAITMYTASKDGRVPVGTAAATKGTLGELDSYLNSLDAVNGLNGKPAGATYTIDGTTGKLTSVLLAKYTVAQTNNTTISFMPE